MEIAVAAKHRQLRRIESSTLIALITGAVVGGVAGESVVNILATRCPNVEAVYGVCHNYVLSSVWVVAVDAGSVLIGAAAGVAVRRAFSSTLQRFAGVGFRELSGFVIRGDGARIEWISEGGIRISDRGASGLDVRSSERCGGARIPAGRYVLRVNSASAWGLQVKRG
jgi:hypothetical protein